MTTYISWNQHDLGSPKPGAPGAIASSGVTKQSLLNKMGTKVVYINPPIIMPQLIEHISVLVRHTTGARKSLQFSLPSRERERELPKDFFLVFIFCEMHNTKRAFIVSSFYSSTTRGLVPTVRFYSARLSLSSLGRAGHFGIWRGPPFRIASRVKKVEGRFGEV